MTESEASLTVMVPATFPNWIAGSETGRCAVLRDGHVCRGAARRKLHRGFSVVGRQSGRVGRERQSELAHQVERVACANVNLGAGWSVSVPGCVTFSVIGGVCGKLTVMVKRSGGVAGVAALSRTRTFNAKVPAVYGVPVSTPSSEIARSFVSVEASVQWNGAVPPVAVKTCRYGMPAVAGGQRRSGRSIVSEVCVMLTPGSPLPRRWCTVGSPP